MVSDWEEPEGEKKLLSNKFFSNLDSKDLKDFSNGGKYCVENALEEVKKKSKETKNKISEKQWMSKSLIEEMWKM